MTSHDLRSLATLTGALLFIAPALAAQAHHPSPPRVSAGGGRMRLHYIAADEVDWTYILAPARSE